MSIRSDDLLKLEPWIIDIVNEIVGASLISGGSGSGGGGLTDAYINVTGDSGSAAASGSDTLNFSGSRGIVTAVISGAPDDVEVAMPTGTSEYTLRFDGTDWIKTEFLTIAAGGSVDVHAYGGPADFNLERANGTVGVPTQAPASSSVGQITFTGYDSAAYRSIAAILAITGTAPTAASSPGLLRFATTTGGTTVPVTRMEINSDGEVGVGIVPLSVFHVADVTTAKPVFLENTTASDALGAQDTGISFRGWDTGDVIAQPIASILVNHDTAATDNAGRFTLYTNSGAGAVEAIRIDSSQNVGLGGVVPTQRLHVSGNMRLTGDFFDKNNSAGTAGEVLSSLGPGLGTDWVAAAGGIANGTITDSTLRWSGAAWVENTSMLSDTSGTITLDSGGAGNAIISHNVGGTTSIANVDTSMVLNNAGTQINFWVNAFQELSLNNTELYPNTDNNIDLGTATLRYKDIHGHKLVFDNTHAHPKIELFDGGSEQIGTDENKLILQADKVEFRRGYGAATSLLDVVNGELGLGTTNPLADLHIADTSTGLTPAAGADNIFIDHTGDGGMTIMSGATNTGSFYFGRSGFTNLGGLVYNHNNDELWLRNNSGNLIKTTTAGHFVPSVHNAQDLGTAALKWRDLYLQSGAFSSAITYETELPITHQPSGTSLMKWRTDGHVVHDKFQYAGGGGGSVKEATMYDVFAAGSLPGIAERGDAGVVTPNGVSAVDITAGSALIRTSDDPAASLEYVAWSAVTNQSLAGYPASTTVYIYITYSTGSTIQYSTTDPGEGEDVIRLATVNRDGTDVEVVVDDRLVLGAGAESFTQLREEVFGTTVNGMQPTEVGTRNLQLAVGAFAKSNGVLIEFLTVFDTSIADTFNIWYSDGGGGWTKTTGQTQLSDTKYDNGSGTLATVPNNKFIKHWVYRGENGNVNVLMAQDTHNTEAGAISAVVTLPDDLALENAVHPIATWHLQEGSAPGTFTFNGNQLSFNGNIVPELDDEFTLGTPEKRWAAIHLASKVHYSGELSFYNSHDSEAPTVMALTPDGNIALPALSSAPSETAPSGMRYLYVDESSGGINVVDESGNTSTPDGGGVMPRNIKKITASYTLQPDDYILHIDSSVENTIVDLPAIETVNKRMIYIKNASTLPQSTVTITPEIGVQIERDTAVVLRRGGATGLYVMDGHWWIGG